MRLVYAAARRMKSICEKLQKWKRSLLQCWVGFLTNTRLNRMAKGQDKKKQGDKTKAQRTLKEKRALKRAKKNPSQGSIIPT